MSNSSASERHRTRSFDRTQTRISTANGCGCQSGLLRFFKPPLAKYFYVPCCMHDDAYDWGGSSFDRFIADRMLFYNMAKLILKNEFNPFKILPLVSIALCYYVAVRIFGRFYFNSYS